MPATCPGLTLVVPPFMPMLTQVSTCAGAAPSRVPDGAANPSDLPSDGDAIAGAPPAEGITPAPWPHPPADDSAMSRVSSFHPKRIYNRLLPQRFFWDITRVRMHLEHTTAR